MHIPPFEFENWAVIALGGIPNKVQVGDMGVDGRIFPVSSSAAPRKQQPGELGLKERWYPMPVRHGQTPARRLRSAGKRTAPRSARPFQRSRFPFQSRPSSGGSFVDDDCWWRWWCVRLNDNADAGADVRLIGEFPAQAAAKYPHNHKQGQPDEREIKIHAIVSNHPSRNFNTNASSSSALICQGCMMASVMPRRSASLVRFHGFR